MNATVKDWLPDAAVTPERIVTALAAPLDQWSRDWFADARTVRVSERAVSLEEHGEGQLSLEAQSVQFLLSALGKRHLLEAILSEPLAGKSLTPADHKILDGLAVRACQDLVDRLAELPAVAAVPNEDVRQLSVLLGGEECGQLALPTAALVSLIKARLIRSATAHSQPLTNRHLAIGGCQAAIDAVLGQVAVTVDELNGLEPGDILILDQPVDQPVPLRLLVTGGPLGKGKLTSSDGHNAVVWQT